MLPIALMILFSFNNPAGKSNFAWQGFTLEYWLNPLGVAGPAEAVGLSLVIAVLSTLIATVLGTLIALALVRYDFRGRRRDQRADLPADGDARDRPRRLAADAVRRRSASRPVLPAQRRDTILIAHIMFNISFVVVTVRARLAGFPRHLEEAAMDLYANESQTFWKVTFPLILPGHHRGRAARVQPLDRRLRRHQLHVGQRADLPDVHLRQEPHRRPGPGQRDRHDHLPRRGRRSCCSRPLRARRRG